MKPKRICHIVDAAIELAGGAGDGAYDLHGQVGTPEEIGKMIGDSLAESDLMTGPTHSNLEAGVDLYLDLRIKFRLVDEDFDLEAWKEEEE